MFQSLQLRSKDLQADDIQLFVIFLDPKTPLRPLKVTQHLKEH